MPCMRCMFFPPLHAASANPIPVLFFSLKFPDRWHTKWKSLIWWFFRVHVHFTAVFLLITTAEEEKTRRCPGGWDVGSCNLWELNIKWRQAFHVCTLHIRRVSLSMMLALIWHFDRVKCRSGPPSHLLKEWNLIIRWWWRVPVASWAILLSMKFRLCYRIKSGSRLYVAPSGNSGQQDFSILWSFLWLKWGANWLALAMQQLLSAFHNSCIFMILMTSSHTPRLISQWTMSWMRKSVQLFIFGVVFLPEDSSSEPV